MFHIDSQVELDATLGDLYAMISDREIEILQELSATILQYSAQFIEISEAVSELDWYVWYSIESRVNWSHSSILSLALVALRFNYVKPHLTLDNTLDIVKGR